MLAVDNVVVPCFTEGHWEPPPKQIVSVSNDTDHIFKAKHHNNLRKDVNTFADSQKQVLYVGFLQIDEGRRIRKNNVLWLRNLEI